MIIGLILSAASSAALVVEMRKTVKKFVKSRKTPDMIWLLLCHFFFWSRQKSHFWQIEQERVTYLARQFRRGLELASFSHFHYFSCLPFSAQMRCICHCKICKNTQIMYNGLNLVLVVLGN